MRLLIAIGFLLISSELMAQSANSWVKKNDFGGYKREQAVAFSIGNKGYVATGVDTSETVRNDLWEYNPDVDSWTQRADLPASGRRSASAFTLNNKGYVGLGITSDEATLGTRLNDLWEYNPINNSWTPKANFPGGGGAGIYYATGFSADDKGYICGGKVGPSSYVNDLWEYKPSLDQWTQRADFPGGIRYNMSSLTINNIAYVGLGTDQDAYRNDWWKYHPGSNQWTPQTDFIGGNRGGASTFTCFDQGYVCLGTNGGLKGDLFVFDPVLNAWYPRADYEGSERKQAISFTINNRSFVGLGSGPNGKKGSMYEYIPEDFLDLETSQFKVIAFPNPTTDMITVSLEQVVKRYTLIDQSGNVVLEEEVMNDHFSIHRNQLPDGMYYCTIQFEGTSTPTVLTIQFVGE